VVEGAVPRADVEIRDVAITAQPPVPGVKAARAARRLLPLGRSSVQVNRLAVFAAKLTGAQSAQVSLLTDVQTVAGGHGLGPDAIGGQSPLADSLCTVTAASGRALIVADARADPRVAGLPPVVCGSVGSYLGVPLVAAGGHIVGSLCVFDSTARDWEPGDVDILGELAISTIAELEMAALARELSHANSELARIASRNSTLAVALQQAMLPALPEPDDLHIVAGYRPAAEDTQVGGDWYDAIVLPTGATTLMIGDVAGHDITALALMGQIRNLLRAFASEHPDDPPSAVITRLDCALRDLGLHTTATLTVARIDQAPEGRGAGRRTLRWSSAGHPPLALVRADGAVELLQARPDLILGVNPFAKRQDHSCDVPPGATLILYTDGLIETRQRSIAHGLDALRTVLGHHYQLDPDQLINAVMHDMVDHHPEDDIAILAVRFQSEGPSAIAL
jgi:serine phosphatase RsbU (regulator of sigma subunit)